MATTPRVEVEWVPLRDAARRRRLAALLFGRSEAQAVLMVAAVRDAAIEAGIDAEQVRAMGTALRRRLEEQAAVAEIESWPGA